MKKVPGNSNLTESDPLGNTLSAVDDPDKVSLTATGFVLFAWSWNYHPLWIIRTSQSFLSFLQTCFIYFFQLKKARNFKANQDFEELKAKHSSENLFFDAEFPAEDSSIGFDKTESNSVEKIEWLRPRVRK